MPVSYDANLNQKLFDQVYLTNRFNTQGVPKNVLWIINKVIQFSRDEAKIYKIQLLIHI